MDNLWFRHYSDPLLTMSTHEFFEQVRTGVTSIVVTDVNEKEYWEGLQLISGQSYRVLLKDDLTPSHHRQLSLRGVYYTYDPLDRSS